MILCLVFMCTVERTLGQTLYVEYQYAWDGKNESLTDWLEVSERFMMLACDVRINASSGAIGPVTFNYFINTRRPLLAYNFTGSINSAKSDRIFGIFGPSNDIAIGDYFTSYILSPGTATYLNGTFIDIIKGDYVYSAYFNCFNNASTSCTLNRTRVASGGPHYFVLDVNSANTKNVQYITIKIAALQSSGIPFTALTISDFNNTNNLTQTTFSKGLLNMNYLAKNIDNGLYKLILSGNEIVDIYSGFNVTVQIIITECDKEWCAICNDNGSCNLTTSGIVGSVFGSLVGLILITFVIFYIRKKKQISLSKEQSPLLEEK